MKKLLLPLFTMKRVLLCFIVTFNFILFTFNSSAQAPNWVWAENHGNGNIEPNANGGMTVDANGNSYVTGNFTGGSVTLGSYTLTNAGNWDMYVVKCDPNGNVVWAKGAGTSGNGYDLGNCVAVDSAGSVYVAGYYRSSTITFGTTTLTNIGSSNIFLVKYDANGNVLWAKGAGGTGQDDACGIAIDAYGNVVVAGYFESPSIKFGSTTLTNTALGTTFITKYDGSGNVVWAEAANSFGGGNGNGGYAMYVDKKNNIYITGEAASPTAFGVDTIKPIGTNDAIALKLDGAGNVRWAKNFGGSGVNTIGYAITADNNSNVYVTGSYNGSSITFGSTVLTAVGGGFAVFTVKYDSSGNPQWGQSAGGYSDQSEGIATDNSNNVYVTGYFSSSSITFGTYTFNEPSGGPGNGNAFIVKYDPTGTVLWAYGAGWGIPGDDAFYSCAINDGYIYIDGGFTSDSITMGNTALINSSPGSWNGFVAKLSICGLNVSTSTASSTCKLATGSATATASNGTPPYSYFWTNGSSNSTADSLSSGLYVVTVYDNAGCKTTATAKVLDVGAPVITVDSADNVRCPGSNTGSITISVSGGTTPYAYYWDNGSTNKNVSSLTAGPYQIEVTDAAGCKATQVVPISQPPAFSLSVSTATASCSGSDGSATADVSGGTGSYTYLWTPSGQTMYDASSLAAGSYTLVVTDAAGCKDSINAAVENSGGPIVTVIGIIHADCFTGTNGSIEISNTGGTGPYSYTWSNGSTSSSLSAPAGFYNVTVTDGSGCKGIVSAQILDTLPQGVSLCEVTVDSNEQNQVLWNRSAEHKIASYNIYRETTTAGIYRLAATIPYDSLTLWTDPIAVPESRGYRYKISETDSCGDESALSNYDLTLHLSIDEELPAGTYKLIWDTSYNGFSFTKYYIYRDTVITNYTVIDSVPKGTQTYTDFYVTTKNIYYRVGINTPGGCNPTTHRTESINYNASKSNTGNIFYTGGPTGTQTITAPSKVEVYPNPNNGKFSVEITNSKLGITNSIEVYNVLGEKIYSSTLNSSITQLNLSGNADGVYLYRVITETGGLVSEGKLVIEK